MGSSASSGCGYKAVGPPPLAGLSTPRRLEIVFRLFLLFFVCWLTQIVPKFSA